MVWIFLASIALMNFGIVVSGIGLVNLPNTNLNAPFVIQSLYSEIGMVTLLMTTAFVNSAAARDFACNTSQIVFSTPVGKRDFLAGPFPAQPRLP